MYVSALSNFGDFDTLIVVTMIFVIVAKLRHVPRFWRKFSRSLRWLIPHFSASHIWLETAEATSDDVRCWCLHKFCLIVEYDSGSANVIEKAGILSKIILPELSSWVYVLCCAAKVGKGPLH